MTQRIILYSVLLLILSGVFGISCSKDAVENPDLTNDAPRILSNWPPKTSKGLPGEFNVILGQEFVQKIAYTPTAHASCVWYLDGVQVAEGTTFTYTASNVGKYYIKVIIRTADKQTFREANLIVSNP